MQVDILMAAWIECTFRRYVRLIERRAQRSCGSWKKRYYLINAGMSILRAACP
jgi:hypothetical protein